MIKNFSITAVNTLTDTYTVQFFGLLQAQVPRSRHLARPQELNTGVALAVALAQSISQLSDQECTVASAAGSLTRPKNIREFMQTTTDLDRELGLDPEQLAPLFGGTAPGAPAQVVDNQGQVVTTSTTVLDFYATSGTAPLLYATLKVNDL